MKYSAKLTIVIAFLSFAFFNSLASGSQLKGKISDSNGLALTGAGITILSPGDSSIIHGTVSDVNGNFLLNDIPNGNIIIRISFVGFKDVFINKTLNTPLLDLGPLVLQEKSSTLDEVTITEKTPPVQVKGDTTQYNADAYKTNRDATTEDLVTKMPGVTMQDGKVQAQGEEVKKVLIDGKPYLGDDPNAALKNLPAEVVEKIQVFDKKSDQSEFTGFDDGNTTKTMNIVTRPQFRNGTFGRVFSGAGTEDRWKAGMNINFFKDKRKITLLGNANNINEQNFSSDDLLGVMSSSSRTQQRGSFGPRGGAGGSGGGGRYQPQNDVNNFLVDQKNGISKTYSGGINFANQWKKLDFTISYFYNNSENNAVSNLSRQYFTAENNNLTYVENNLGNTKNANHRSNMRFEYKFDTLNSILLQPRFSFQTNKSNNFLSGNNSDAGGQLSNSVNTYNSDLNGSSYSVPLLYRHSFLKKGRTFSANLTNGYNQNKGNSDRNSLTVYTSDSTTTDTLNQVSDINSQNWNYSAEITYTEPVSTRSQLSLTYRGSYNKSISDKTTYSYMPAEELYNALDSSLSNKFKSDYLTQSAGTSYRYQTEKWNAMAGLSFQQAKLKNNQEFPDISTMDKTYNSVLPNAMIQYRFTPKKNLRIYARSSNNSPSITQLQNVINNTNPLQVVSGNPSLKQDWQNFINVRYSAINSEKKTSFFVFLSGNYTLDYIGNSSFIASSDTAITNDIILSGGSQFSRPVNIDGYYSVRSFGNFSFPVDFLKSMLNLNANVTYSRTPGLVNDVLNYSSSTGSGLGFALSSNISEKVDFLLSSNGSLNGVSNTIGQNSNSNYFNLNSKFRIQVMPWKGLVLQTDLNHQYNSGLSQSYNQNYYLWNAAIGYKFLKNNVAEIRLNVFDILKQNNNISRNTTDLYIEDVQSNVLQQYFMLTFTYNLKFYKTVKEP